MSTGGTGRNRRRRGRRGQRGRREAQQQQQHYQQDHQGSLPQPPEVPIQTEMETPARERQRVTETNGADADQYDDNRSGSRKRSRSRRSRTIKRPTLSVQPAEVLKERVRDLPTTGHMTMRTLDEFETAGGMTFGCPMLTRTRMGMPFAEGRHMPRCSMGWALHDEEEASFCMRTPDLLDCWKEHPEREAELRGSRESENAAD